MQTNPHTPQPGTGLLALVSEAVQLEQTILRLAEENSGEIDQQLEKYLDSVKATVATKADHYKFVMDRLEMAAAQMEDRADEFYRAAKALETVQESMKARIKEAMTTMGTDEVKGEQWRFKLSKTKGRLVVDADFQKKLPPEFLLVKTVYEPEKDKIRAAIEAGREIPGATIEPGFSLRSYVNKGA